MNFIDQRWLAYLAHFHADRDYYACHDYLEEWWFELGNPQNHLLMAFIQLAVALYHYRADNINGARILLDKATLIFEMNKDLITDYGLDEEALFTKLNELKSNVKHHRPFVDVNLKFSDQLLEKHLHEFCLNQDLDLYASSDMNNLHLIHKHKFKHR